MRALRTAARTRRRPGAVTAVVLAATLLSACNAGDGRSDAVATSTAAEEAPTGPPSTEPAPTDGAPTVGTGAPASRDPSTTAASSGGTPRPATTAPRVTPSSSPSSSPATPPAPAPPPPASGLWRPAPGLTWQWQLTTPVDTGVAAAVYDIDGLDNPASVVATLHAAGRKVICYVDAGAWESYRPDAGRFPPAILGSVVDGWPEERWLDIRRIDLLAPIMRARLDVCRAKGFDGVEFDLVDGYTNDSGFPLTGADQLAYNRWLADEAHARGLAAGLKNDLGQVAELVDHFEFAVNEQCWQYSECDLLAPFLAAGKAVFHAEYGTDPAVFCPALVPRGFSSLKKRLELDAWRQPC